MSDDSTVLLLTHSVCAFLTQAKIVMFQKSDCKTSFICPAADCNILLWEFGVLHRHY